MTGRWRQGGSLNDVLNELTLINVLHVIINRIQHHTIRKMLDRTRLANLEYFIQRRSRDVEGNVPFDYFKNFEYVVGFVIRRFHCRRRNRGGRGSER